MDNHAKLQSLWERFENLTPRQRSLTAAGIFGALDIMSRPSVRPDLDQKTIEIVVGVLESSIKTEEDNAKGLLNPDRQFVEIK